MTKKGKPHRGFPFLPSTHLFSLRQKLALPRIKICTPARFPIFASMKKIHVLTFVLGFWTAVSSSAQSVGLLYADSTAHSGYTLFAPSAATTTYLIDPCGYLVNFWESAYLPGAVAYLEAEGTLYRTGRLPGFFNAGGLGGRIEQFDWDGNLIWHYEYASADFQQHHDIEVLPNGHILLLAWEARSADEAVQAGRDPSLLSPAGLWPEHIVELEPLENNEANIVWEWYLWDHLIQSFDPAKDNFGEIAAHPELVDINFAAVAGGTNSSDWIHGNSIDYNATLDQIMISSRNFNEIWVIDHSTTTAEAASHTGGNSGRGGDLLYRWGNPAAYQRGAPEDRQLFNQHDAHWIPEGLPGAGEIMVFNNGIGRTPSYSTVDQWAPPVDADGNYGLVSGEAYGPASFSWTYEAENPSSFFSPRISGAQRLPNGNTLICEGIDGRFFEVSQNGSLAWEYVNPVGFNGPTVQGDVPFGVDVFRAYRFSATESALAGFDLAAGAPIELDPWDYDCALADSTALSTSLISPHSTFLQVIQNPFRNQLLLEKDHNLPLHGSIYSLDGQLIESFSMTESEQSILAEDWPMGLYILRVWSDSGIPQHPIRLIKQ